MKTNHAINMLEKNKDYKVLEVGSYHVFKNGIGQTFKRIYPLFKCTPNVFKMLKNNGNCIRSVYNNIRVGDIVSVSDLDNYYIEVIAVHNTYITMANMVDYTPYQFEKGIVAFHWNRVDRFHNIEDDTILNWFVKDKPLTLSDRQFLKGIMSGLTEMEASEMAGYKKGTHLPKSISKEIGESEKLGFFLQQELVKVLEQKGIDTNFMSDKMIELLSSDSDSVKLKAFEKLMALMNMPVMNKVPLVAIQQVNNSHYEDDPHKEARDNVFQNASELIAEVEDDEEE